MRYLLLCFIVCLCFAESKGQIRKYSTFYEQRASLFEELPIGSRDIIFLGNSITNGSEWCELFRNKRVKNRGISGDVAYGVYDRLEPIVKGHPAKIFLLIGINDVARGTSADTIAERIGMIVRKIKRESPKTKVYLQSVLPVNDCYQMFKGHTSRGSVIPQLNNLLVELAKEEQITYVDLWSHFAEPESGKMKPEYTNDGLHLLGKGYLLWRDIVLPYIKEK